MNNHCFYMNYCYHIIVNFLFIIQTCVSTNILQLVNAREAENTQEILKKLNYLKINFGIYEQQL